MAPSLPEINNPPAPTDDVTSILRNISPHELHPTPAQAAQLEDLKAQIFTQDLDYKVLTELTATLQQAKALIERKSAAARHLRLCSGITSLREDVGVLKPLVADTHARVEAAKELKLD